MDTLFNTIELIALFLAIILHELAHGYVAFWLGDHTAKQMGRLSFNPIRHADPIGTIIFPAFLHFSGASFIFGWAKPVPVNYNNFKKTKRDIFLVSSAGIFVNIILYLVFGFIATLLVHQEANLVTQMIFKFCVSFAFFNIILAAFNLLPIPPLDGSKMFLNWIEKPWAQKYINSQFLGLGTILFIGIIIPEIFSFFGIDFNPIKIYISYVLQMANNFLI
ncbi:MAG: site-2 protease family protein [Alphaproteobacteria bacterium]